MNVIAKPAAISRVLIIPGLNQSDSRRFLPDEAAVSAQNVISVGLVIDNDKVAWGDCAVSADSQHTGKHDALSLMAGTKAIRDRVVPELTGRSLTRFREMAAEIDSLTEYITETEPISHDPYRSQTGRISRRAFFTGFLSPTLHAVAPKTVKIERPLHPAIRHAVSQALLAAVARARDLTMAELLIEEYELPVPDSLVPIHAAVLEVSDVTEVLKAHRIESIEYAFSSERPKSALGVGGGILHETVREIDRLISVVAEPPDRPSLHINLNGGLGTICDHNVGRMLGVLFGLKDLVDGNLVRIENPVIMDSQKAQIETLHRLRGYLRFRELPVELVANTWIDSLKDVNAFIESGATHMIRLDMSRLGSLHQSIESILACRRHGVGVMLASGPAEAIRSALTACHVALAAKPDLLISTLEGRTDGMAACQKEMTQTLAQLGQGKDG
jgi:methylaspartate ammonia-lyase